MSCRDEYLSGDFHIMRNSWHVSKQLPDSVDLCHTS